MNKIKAKDASLVAKILGGIIILAGHILMWLDILPNATSKDICACGGTIMLLFTTVDLNILCDKFTKKVE